MPLSYEINEKLKTILPVLDACAAWHAGVVRFLFYPEQHGNDSCLEMPPGFSAWVESGSAGEFVPAAVVEDLCDLQAELQRSVNRAGQLALSMGGNSKLPMVMFEEVNRLHEHFMLKLRRVATDCLEMNNGLDPLTGLRHRQAMEHDLANEIERRARQGRPFTLALAHIDRFDELRRDADEEEFAGAIKAVSALIKKCVRSFDDAYRSDEGEFIMLLKHADVRGGTAAVERMRGFLQETPVGVRTVKGDVRPVTLSYCVAEPLPEESMEQLLKNMREDLQQYDGAGEKALEYIEQSPLLRYVSTTGDK